MGNDYKDTSSQDRNGEIDYEELFEIVSYTIVKNNYKEFYRELVTEELNVGIGGFNNINATDVLTIAENYYKEIITERSEFYDEYFAPLEKEYEVNNDKKTNLTSFFSN